MSSSGVPDDQPPNFAKMAEGYKTEIKQSLETLSKLKKEGSNDPDPDGSRFLGAWPRLNPESQAIISRMIRYDQMDGNKSRLCTVLELYYEQAGKKLDEDPLKTFLGLWDKLKANAKQGDNPPTHLQ